MSRIIWIDAARGIGILLVVFGHVWRGMFGAGLISDEQLYISVDQFIYLFHMPVFFILSGFVFLTSRWNGVFAFLKSRIVYILWPAILWFYIFIGSKVLINDAVNSPIDSEQLFTWPNFGGTYLWFLWALFLIHLASIILFLIPRRIVPSLVLLGMCMAIFLRYCGCVGIPLFLATALAFLPFFLIGVGASTFQRTSMIISTTLALIIGFIGLILFFYVQYSVSDNLMFGNLKPLFQFAASVGFICMIIAACRLFSNQQWVGIVVKIGQASMAIYLAHVFFTAGIRIVAQYSGVSNIWFHTILGTIVGVIGPLLVLKLSQHFGIRKFLGL